MRIFDTHCHLGLLDEDPVSQVRAIDEAKRGLALDKEKIKSHERLDTERERFNRSIDFLKEQIAYKDKRMDMLLDSVFKKDEQHKEMLDRLLKCSKCDQYEA